MLKFDWDERKNAENICKHEVSFDEAQSVWADPLANEYYDPDHSDDEDRWIRIGYSFCRLLVVSFAEKNDTIRIISARQATKKEIRAHEG